MNIINTGNVKVITAKGGPDLRPDPESITNSDPLSYPASNKVSATSDLIRGKIYEIRGRKVMLDFDLSEMYGIETKRLKEAVRRNIERFPDDFMFTLTKQESINLRSQIASSRWGGSRYQPFAFTEQKS
jgi:hypothetical protein